MAAHRSPSVGLGTSLDKFFTDSPVPRTRHAKLSGLRGEVLAFQVVYCAGDYEHLQVTLHGAVADWCSLYRVDLAHVEHPTYAETEALRIGTAPGFYPDPLVPAENYRAFPNQTRAIWVSIRIPEDARGGTRKLRIQGKFDAGQSVELTASVKVIPVSLPAQELEIIHWFHNDCLMSHYGFEAWSSEHWRMAEIYLRDAVEHGVNVMTTPMFTPPLDTAIGTERPTVQLVGVTVDSPGVYSFDFRRLGKWISLCQSCGVTHFELSHLSTQWGAKCAPKIVGTVNGHVQKIFGWDDASTGEAYSTFLMQFLPRLVQYLKRRGILDKCYLHVSDEPNLEHLSQYRAVRELLRKGAPELPVLEALSDFDFFGEGVVDRPCPANNHVQPFLDAGVSPLWVYYCCAQSDRVANRFMDFPSPRNRILGWQLYKFGFDGFLHWGYNHWYEGITDQLIDPYTNSHAGRPLPPGDGFVVYPGPDGPIGSIRWEVFREGIQDYRALKLLTDLAGENPKEPIKKLLRMAAVRSMTSYPRSDNWLLSSRDSVNAEIAKRL